MTRVAFGNLISSAVDRTNVQTDKLFLLQRQLATGKKIERASEDPELAARTQRISTKIRRDEQRIRSIDLNGRMIAEAETYMTSAIEQLQRLRTLALQAANGTYTTGDMQVIASEVNQQLESLLATANSRSGGRSIFAGAETDTDAFTAIRNGIGEITSVNYSGDSVELELEAGINVPLTWPGDRVFAAGASVLRSTSTNWDGTISSEYADREMAAAFLPSSGVTEGQLRINDVLVGYDLDGNPTTAEGDSLLDLSRKINDANAGVTASVTGVMRGNNTFALPLGNLSALAGFTAGTISVNGQSVSVSGNDTLFTFTDRLNALTSSTGVTAEIYDAAGQLVDGTPALSGATSPLTLRLSGGVEISDDAVGSSNIMQLAGITRVPSQPTGSNLVGTVLQNYALQLTNQRPGTMTIEDASGSLAVDLGLTTAAAETGGGSIFQSLIAMRDALRRGDAAGVRDTNLPEIDAALDAVALTRSEAGVRTNELESQKERLTSIVLNQKEVLSDLEDVDLSEIISELKTQQTAQSAALKSISDLLNLSLLNFLS